MMRSPASICLAGGAAVHRKLRMKSFQVNKRREMDAGECRPRLKDSDRAGHIGATKVAATTAESLADYAPRSLRGWMLKNGDNTRCARATCTPT
jgi:hypothetical protein